jgi:DNA-binding GntR family transcriptional regulator
MTLPEPLTPLVRSSLSDATADLLRRKILSGEYAPGTRLVEAEIARQLAISRGPVREALASLQAEGLTTVQSGRSFVRVLTAREVREIYDVRATLESGAIRLIGERDDPASLAALTAAAEVLRRANGSADLYAFVEADLGLHEAICRAAANDRLFEAWSSEVTLLRALFRLEVEELTQRSPSLTLRHLEIVAAIQEGRTAEAIDMCWALFREAANALGGILDARQDSSGTRPTRSAGPIAGDANQDASSDADIAG